MLIQKFSHSTPFYYFVVCELLETPWFPHTFGQASISLLSLVFLSGRCFTWDAGKGVTSDKNMALTFNMSGK